MHDHPHGRSCDHSAHPPRYPVFSAFMRVLHTHRNFIGAALGDLGSNPGQSMCMREIAHNEGISQAELAKLLGIKPPTVSVMLQKLERAGLVERRADEHDQRYMRLYLTDDGRARHENIHDRIGTMVGRVIDPMSEDDRRELERLLTLLNDNMLAAIEDETRKERD